MPNEMCRYLIGFYFREGSLETMQTVHKIMPGRLSLYETSMYFFYHFNQCEIVIRKLLQLNNCDIVSVGIMFIQFGHKTL